MKKLPDKAGDHRGIRPVGILTASEDIEITQTNRGNAIQTVVKTSVFLAGPLGKRVRREQLSFLTFLFRQKRMIAVYRRGGCINKTLHAALSGRFHHVQRTADIILLIEKRHLDAAGHTPPGRLVQHIIHALAGLFADFQILDVAEDEFIRGIVL